MKYQPGALLSIFFLYLSAIQAAIGGDIDRMKFWDGDEPRKGANYFNAVPEARWFEDARELGIEWVRLAYDKWSSQERDFLIGNADNFTSLVQKDLDVLMEVLDWAHKYGIKVVVTPLSLPGNRWSQNNDDQRDLRLWNDKTYWDQSAKFWSALAAKLKNHPAVYGYNLINEPTPEMGTGLEEHGPADRYTTWYENYKNTSHDLPAFYIKLLAAIRDSDTETPVMLDAGWYAQPDAFTHWPRMPDSRILYSFHMYEPYSFTSAGNFRKEANLTYPGVIPFAGESTEWNMDRIKIYLEPFLKWAEDRDIPANRLVCGEFGCYRRNTGCDQYLSDVISVLNNQKIHWAFYSFREDEWDGYDYEIGTGGLGWKYWEAKEKGMNPSPPRQNNPLFEVIRREFQK